jgi:hypothetical protein
VRFCGSRADFTKENKKAQQSLPLQARLRHYYLRMPFAQLAFFHES